MFKGKVIGWELWASVAGTIKIAVSWYYFCCLIARLFVRVFVRLLVVVFKTVMSLVIFCHGTGSKGSNLMSLVLTVEDVSARRYKQMCISLGTDALTLFCCSSAALVQSSKT